MHVFREIAPLQAHLKQYRISSSSLGFVPTMGALHQGHLSLIRASRRECALTICSIYVNPSQFNNKDDFEKYPRPMDRDLELLKEAGCDIAFCPENTEMYNGSAVYLKFDFGPMGETLEGQFRPGHFSGVALVVAKLFHIVEPDFAYFGQKDFQQFRIISHLVKELKFNIILRCIATVREKDGLAMSSRNIRLSPEQRRDAPALFQALMQVKNGLLEGKGLDQLTRKAKAFCKENRIDVDYLTLADVHGLMALDKFSPDQQSILLIAGKLGDVRLIDNLPVN